MKHKDSSCVYGVWQKGKGWLRSKDVFADASYTKALQVAEIIHGDVRFIDNSLIDLEPVFLEAERNTKWATFLNLFKRKDNTPHNS